MRSYCFCFFLDYIEQGGDDPPMWTIELTLCSPIQLLIHIFYNFLQKICEKAEKFFILLHNSKEEGRTVNYGTRQYECRRGLKGPRLRQQPQLLPFGLNGPDLESLAEDPFIGGELAHRNWLRWQQGRRRAWLKGFWRLLQVYLHVYV